MVPIGCWFQVKRLCLMTPTACCCWRPCTSLLSWQASVTDPLHRKIIKDDRFQWNISVFIKTFSIGKTGSARHTGVLILTILLIKLQKMPGHHTCSGASPQANSIRQPEGNPPPVLPEHLFHAKSDSSSYAREVFEIYFQNVLSRYKNQRRTIWTKT